MNGVRSGALHAVEREAISEMLGDNQYWREAVKNAKWDVGDEYGAECGFCGGEEHSPDCPYLLAQ